MVGNIETHGDIASYYSNKLAEHGAMPRGVDWNGVESQLVRFAMLRCFMTMASTNLPF